MPKRILKGVVVSDKADKTITVLVKEKLCIQFIKYINKTKKYSVHDEDNKFKVGEIVTIQENKPISKTKTWIALKVG